MTPIASYLKDDALLDDKEVEGSISSLHSS